MPPWYQQWGITEDRSMPPKKKATQVNTPFRFAGFSAPRYTQVPDQLFDELLSVLTGAELKVLLYICRRTFGFKKDSDNISINQMLNGIRRKDGTNRSTTTHVGAKPPFPLYGPWPIPRSCAPPLRSKT